MRRTVEMAVERFPIAGTFRIARGSKTEAVVVVCTIRQDEKTGRGECVPYARYGETVDSVLAQIKAMEAAVADGISRNDLALHFPAGAARNAIDCALWDLEAKLQSRPAFEIMGMPSPKPLITTQTISLSSPQEMAAQAKLHALRPVLKIKVGLPEGDADRIRAVRQAVPQATLILDANEGWTTSNLEENLQIAAEFGVALIEQPLPAGQDAMLAEVSHAVPICADESLHTRADLAKLARLYDAVNIKLDKTGGLTEGLALRAEAERLGFSIMVGCMVGTSLAMAPAVLLAQGVSFVDLDGPLLLAQDRQPGLIYDGSSVYPPTSNIWG